MRKKRLNFLLTAFIICLCLLASVQVSICFVNGDSYTASAVAQRTGSVTVKQYRGKIYDRNMIPLVESDTQSLMVDENGKIGGSAGTALPAMPVRYGEDGIAAHVVGYVDSDGIGVCGIEKSFNKLLSPLDESRINVIKSADGRLIPGMGMTIEEGDYASDGVVLTLDSHIQRVCEETLVNNNVTGAVVVMDTSTCRVLAMASSPGYDRNDITKHLDSDKGELINRCVSSYNAGSIFKIITLCAAVDNLKLRNVYKCDGFMDIGEHTFGCHKAEGHGELGGTDSLAQSCNCAFYTMGMDLGSNAILNAARSFGIGEPLLNLSDFEESTGNVPLGAEDSACGAVNFAIGQGEILITPLQAANMACIIANSGVRKSVNLVEGIADSRGRLKQSLIKNDEIRVTSIYAAEILKNAMQRAVSEGTGKALASNPARIAGKTGTAETGWVKDGRSLVHGWFCGFFPYDSPRYAMAVLAEDGGSGAASAAPIFGQIAEEIIKIYPIG
ncbi:MAG: penicillin-binding protein 2 [Clostridia bacterium]|nr:penicillin-binding protein 2 [Clostridia bacterium]